MTSTSVDDQAIEEEHRLDHPSLQNLNPQVQERTNHVLTQESHFETENDQMFICHDFPGPAFPKPEVQETLIPGPAPHQLGLPLGELQDQHLTIDEVPGLPLSLPGSKEAHLQALWGQEPAEVDQQLVSLLVK